MPAHSLLWQIPRIVPVEKGFGLTHVPGDVAGQLAGTYAIEPVTGAACAVPDFGTAIAFPVTTGYATTAWHITGAGAQTTYQRTTTGAWTRVSTTALVNGCGFLLGLIQYPGSGPTVLSFGRAWTLTLTEGFAQLAWDGTLAAEPAELWTPDEWYDGPLWLHVYCLGTRLVVRRWKSADSQLTAFLDADPYGTGYALPADNLTLAHTGYLAWVAYLEGHATSFWLEHSVIRMARPSSQIPEIDTLAVSNAGDVITAQIRDAGGFQIVGGTDETEFTYYVSASLASASGPNLYLHAVRARFPAEYASDGATPTNLAGSIRNEVGVALKETLDPRQNAIDFTLQGASAALDAYRQVNVAGRWSPDGAARVEFLTGDSRLRRGRGSKDYLQVTGAGPWKRLENALWSGGRTYAGWNLATALADVLDQAGVGALAYSITAALDYDLPDDTGSEESLFDFRTDQTVADGLLYLLENFAAQVQVRFGTDGVLYLEDPPTAATGTVFTFTMDQTEAETGWDGVARTVLANTARGVSAHTGITAWEDRYRDDWLRNEVVVVGYDRGRPLLAAAVDWRSQTDVTAANYVGEQRLMVIVDAGLTTQAAVNWVCRQVYERVRVLHRFAEFTAFYQPGLVVGELVEVTDEGLWRIESIGHKWMRRAPHGEADYEARYYGEA